MRTSRMRGFRWVCGAGWATAMLVAALGTAIAGEPKGAGAAAQGAQGASTAAKFFDEGTTHYEASRWADAEAAFEKAWALRKSHDIAANLGDCELRVGQAREAAEHLAFAVGAFPVSGKEAVLKRLMERFAEAKREVGTLRVRVNVEGAAILIGGRKVGVAPMEREAFVDPGTATLEVRLAGYEAYATTIEMKKGGEREVEVALVPIKAMTTAAAPAVMAAAPTPSTTTMPGEATRQRSMLPVYVGLGATAVSIGIGIGLLGAANGARADANAQVDALDRAGAQCPSATHGAQCDALQSAVERADAFGNGAMVSLALGGAALAGTAAYLLFWPEAKQEATGVKQERTRVRVVPVAGRDGGGAALLGRF